MFTFLMKSLKRLGQRSTLDIATALDLAEISIKQLIEMKNDPKYFNNLIDGLNT